jgi:hypothetical protein
MKTAMAGEVVKLSDGKCYRAEVSSGCEGCAFASNILMKEEAELWDLCTQVTCAGLIFIEEQSTEGAVK